MKYNYTNILLFSLSLNILFLSSGVYNQGNHNLTLYKPTTTSRLLCECELYAPSNYDNDPEMKAVIHDFDHQTSERYKEYDKRTIKNRKKCKDQCDKEIQKIILKDKIEKELTEKLATLETNITTKDIPTCVCEKSLADKTEKFCLNCGFGLGSGVLQSLGLFGGSGIYAWTIGAPAAAIAAAKEAGAAAGIKAGHAVGATKVVELVNSKFGVETLGGQTLNDFFTATNYMNETLIFEAVHKEFYKTCVYSGTNASDRICIIFNSLSTGQGGTVTANEFIGTTAKEIVTQAQYTSNATASNVTTVKTAALKAKNMAVVEAGFDSYITAVNASIAAIFIIVLVMVIIYLILRYRRKKKMKKKLQYIKLLKE
ncbi:rifin [Plasmodium falciparum NF54]|uniref:Rifin n=2 Tax=Plasmodium falciparum TaxID=5833 RepID=Q8IHM3_PLAF7|nr:rifin [Plasmodium falciparum 3D7]EWC87685.1 hypothetical protein PFNF54_03533 [Plasmodium falciparum NF54]KAF4328901.1 rifin [Plasmodium falciparum NF54]PKC46715.1 rifin [Plasmodium falciparum NF54]CZT99158.1 rifin [Plasmodium falciparum 3D7]|eukprot:XP_001348173.2 rifin [Plasmodium falciparum 3D7]